jgi:hypothetical protein
MKQVQVAREAYLRVFTSGLMTPAPPPVQKAVGVPNG